MAILLLDLAVSAPLVWILLVERPDSWTVILFSILVGLNGACAPLVRPVVELLRRSRTIYAVTDERILVSRGRRRKIKSYLLRKLSTPTLEEHPDGSGTIRFYSWLLFDVIDEPREVFETVQRAQMAVQVQLPEPYPRPAEEAG